MSGNADWWRGLPSWLKLVDLFAALPAWLFIIYCIVTDRSKSGPALAAFAVFAAAVLLHIAFDRRRDSGLETGGGADFGPGDG